MLNPATLKGAKKKSQDNPKLLGFQICLPLYLNTYFDMIDRTATRAKGQRKVERMSMLMLIPVMYALETFFFISPYISLERINSVRMLVPMDIKIALKLSRIPKLKCPTRRIRVMNRGGAYLNWRIFEKEDIGLVFNDFMHFHGFGMLNDLCRPSGPQDFHLIDLIIFPKAKMNASLVL